MTEAIAVLIAGIITSLVGIVVGIGGWVIMLRVQRAGARQTEQLQAAELHSAEAIALRSTLEQQGRDMDALRLELYDCQTNHLSEKSARLQLEARVRSLEGDNDFLRRQLDSWTRREERER